MNLQKSKKKFQSTFIYYSNKLFSKKQLLLIEKALVIKKTSFQELQEIYKYLMFILINFFNQIFSNYI